MLVWLAASLWTVGYSSQKAYGTNSSPPPLLIGGMPAWVVWGVVLPWFVVLAVTLWFAGGGISDEELGEDQPVPTEAEH